jgi:hypothetical protein
MDEQIQNIVENGIRVVVEQEAVHGGFRPIVVLYTLGEDVVTERIGYAYPASSSKWNGGKWSEFILNEGQYKNIEI